MEMFKKLGPRVILVELRGKVCGLVTVKDVLKYQFKVENEERPRVERDEGVEEKVWSWIEGAGIWVNGLWARITRRGPPRTPRTPQTGDGGVRLEEEVELVDRRSDQD
jgi:chloride channel 3/4/5